MAQSRVVSHIVFATAIGALAATKAAAGIDVEVPLALSAKGTFLPAGEVETYRFDATKGTLVSFQATAGKGAHLAFAAHLFDAGDVELAIPAALLSASAKKLAVRNLPLAATGAYRLEISASGTGEYSLRLTGKPSSRFSGTITVPAAGDVPFVFSAPPGSRVTLTAKAASGGQATPRFGTLSGDGAARDLAATGKLTSTSHSVVLSSVGGTGDLSVDVTNPGATGDVAVTVSVKAPKVKTAKIDSRGAVLGRPQGGESVVVRNVGATGGTVEVADAGSDIDGAAVAIPPGALEDDTTITIASAPPLTTDAADQASGPSIFLGPAGIEFGIPVGVVVPYDAARIPVGETPQDLRVLVVEKDGSSSIRLPASVDVLGRTVTVEANGFSTFVAISQIGQQPLGVSAGGDQFWALNLDAEIRPDASMDSRSREFSLGFGEASFLSGGVFLYTGTRRSFSFDNSTAADGDHLDGRLLSSSGPADFSTTWTYGVDGQTVELGDNLGVALVTSRDGNFIVARRDTAAEPRVETNLFIRKNTLPLTTAVLAGKYHLVRWGVDASDRGPDAGVRPRSSQSIGTWVFDAAGKFALNAASRASDVEGDGIPSVRFESLSASGTFVVEAAGTVLATIPPKGPDSGGVFRFFPGPGGAVLIGTHRDPSDANLEAFVLVRQGAGLGNGLVTGAYRGVSFDTEMFPYTVLGTTGPPFVEFTVADFQMTGHDYALTFSGSGAVTLDSFRHSVRRNTFEADGVRSQYVARPTIDAQSRIDRSGKLTLIGPEGDGPAGAVSPDGTFGCWVTDIRSSDTAHEIVWFVKPPPRK